MNKDKRVVAKALRLGIAALQFQRNDIHANLSDLVAEATRMHNDFEVTEAELKVRETNYDAKVKLRVDKMAELDHAITINSGTLEFYEKPD